MRLKRRLLWCLVLCLASTSCQPSGVATTGRAAHRSHAELLEGDWLVLEHDTGEIPAGADVSHTFTLTNEFSESLRINAVGDIEVSCNCAGVTPAAWELAPGESTSVDVRVTTGLKNGPFRDGGHIIWTDAHNQTHTAAFVLRAVARPPVTFDPEELVFELDDLAKGIAKDLKVTPSSTVDKDSLTLTLPEKDFAIEKKGVECEAVVYSIKCLLPPEADDVGDAPFLVVGARALNKLGGTAVSMSLPIAVHQSVPLLVQPQQLVVRLSQIEQRGAARLMLTGEALTDPGRDIESITCADYMLEWKMSRIGHSTPTVFIDLTFKPKPGDTAPAQSSVQIKVRGRNSRRVPVTVEKET
jgi:hypothetical protein